MAEETWDGRRTQRLQEMLRALAMQITLLDAEGRLLEEGGALMRLIGDVRSELFHYEVRCTYDTPEVAQHRRLVDEAKRAEESAWEPTGDWSPDDDEESEWQRP
jgi:hypothetical protein